MAALSSGKVNRLLKSATTAVAAVILCSTASSASPLLCGYIKEDATATAGASVAPQATPAAAQSAPQAVPINRESRQSYGQPATLPYARAAQPSYGAYSPVATRNFQSTLAMSNQPAVQIQNDPLAKFQGTWQSVTLVTDSLVPTVAAGQRVVSTMEFARSDQGRLYAKWQQPGWQESQSAITVISPDNFMIDRTSYYTADRNSGSWATRSRDQYSLLTNSQILAVSEIDQYIDGRFVGRYCTRSVLTKISDQTSVALR